MSAKSAKVRAVQLPKIILITARVLEKASPALLIRFAARLFCTPIKHKIPKREFEMDQKSLQSHIYVDEIQKEICVYKYGSAEKKILLVHGWSGRGTQLVKIADALLKSGYSTVSFDAPAHGKSSGKTTLMPEFVAAILQIDMQFGPFTAAIGHSLGGMSLLNATKKGFTCNALVTIGSGDVIQDITDDFITKLKIEPKYSLLLRHYFEKKTGETMDSYSAYIAAGNTAIPTLVIHDQEDDEVPVSAAVNIHKHLRHGDLLLTNGLGHRKILGDATVIKNIIEFIKSKENENQPDVVLDDTISVIMPRPTKQ